MFDTALVVALQINCIFTGLIRLPGVSFKIQFERDGGFDVQALFSHIEHDRAIGRGYAAPDPSQPPGARGDAGL